jgi:hypothetical protein
MGRAIAVQQEPSALCSKLWPHPRNTLQRSSDDLNSERTTDYLTSRHKFVINHTLFAKKKKKEREREKISVVLTFEFWRMKLFGPW